MVNLGKKTGKGFYEYCNLTEHKIYFPHFIFYVERNSETLLMQDETDLPENIIDR